MDIVHNLKNNKSIIALIIFCNYLGGFLSSLMLNAEKTNALRKIGSDIIISAAHSEKLTALYTIIFGTPVSFIVLGWLAVYLSLGLSLFNCYQGCNSIRDIVVISFYYLLTVGLLFTWPLAFNQSIFLSTIWHLLILITFLQYEDIARKLYSNNIFILFPVIMFYMYILLVLIAYSLTIFLL